MSEQTDGKLRHVAIADYGYRHEAEFAAGFLDDAEIPYRLQVDDASMGVALSSSATIWVRGQDAERAREILEIDDRPVSLRRPQGTAPDRLGGARPRTTSANGLPSARSSRLTYRERALALIGAGGAMLGARFLIADPSSLLLQRGVVLLAAFLALAGVVGWAPRFVRRILNALSGNVP